MNNVRKAGGWICFDPNIRHDLWRSTSELHECLHHALMLTDVVKVSEDELFFISGERNIRKGMDVLVARHSLAMLLVTQGKDGVTVYWKNRFYHFPCQMVESVDTTGAGDAFVAGLLAALASGGMPANKQALVVAITQAQYCGALATTAKGAMTALPRRHNLNNYI